MKKKPNFLKKCQKVATVAKSAKNVYPFEVEVGETPLKQQAVDDLVRKLFGEPRRLAR
jgi:hypothetical protein